MGEKKIDTHKGLLFRVRRVRMSILFLVFAAIGIIHHVIWFTIWLYTQEGGIPSTQKGSTAAAAIAGRISDPILPVQK
jgi:hypothetical protein